MADSDAQTFLFADLASFTALTDVHGDEEAARVVEEYRHAMRRLLPDHGGSEVKTIGDALLLRVPEACEAVLLGLRATREIGGADHGYPSVRVGMDHGPAVERSGDYLGRTVNIAARVTALASAGEVLVTGDVVQAAGKVESVHLVERGRQLLKGIEDPVLVFLASVAAPESAESLPIDPVCRMAVDPDRAAGMIVHEGVRYYFCSPACLGRFARAPERFSRTEPQNPG